MAAERGREGAAGSETGAQPTLRFSVSLSLFFNAQGETLDGGGWPCQRFRRGRFEGALRSLVD